VGLASAAGLFTMLFGLLAGVLWWLGPDLVNDWRMDRDVIEARAGEATLGDARCRSRLAVFTVCDITFTAGATAEGAGSASRTLWYFFIGTADAEPIMLLRQRQAADRRPMVITTNLGLARLHQRLLTLALMVGLIVFCIAISVEMLRAAARTRRALMDLSGQKLSALVVRIEGSLLIATRRRRWTYLYEDGGGEAQRAFVELPSRLDPLFVTRDGKRALALQGPHGGVPLLLDAELSSLDLSLAERQAFFAACRTAFERGEL
jgi:hypothetical protein